MTQRPLLHAAALIELLARHASAPVAELRRAAEVHRRTGLGLAHVLVRAGLVDARALADVIAEATALPRFDPGQFKPAAADVRRLPFALASRRRVLVIGPRAEGGWYVAFTDPTDRVTHDAVARHLKGPVTPLLVDEITLERGLEHFYGTGTGTQEGAVPELLPDGSALVVGQEVAAELAASAVDFDHVDDAGSFLTESTDAALRTYLEPLAPEAVLAGDEDLAWLRAKQTGAFPGKGSPFDVDPATEVAAVPGTATVPGSAPSMSAREPAAREGATREAREGESGHLFDITLESGREGGDELGGPPTLIDDRPPSHNSDEDKR